MDFVIVNSRGSLIRTFEDEGQAHAALRELSEQTKTPLYLMPYDDEGLPAGRAVMACDLEPPDPAGRPLVTFLAGPGMWAIASGTIAASLWVKTSRTEGVGEVDVTPHEPAPSGA